MRLVSGRRKEEEKKKRFRSPLLIPIIRHKTRTRKVAIPRVKCAINNASPMECVNAGKGLPSHPMNFILRYWTRVHIISEIERKSIHENTRNFEFWTRRNFELDVFPQFYPLIVSSYFNFPLIIEFEPDFICRSSNYFISSSNIPIETKSILLLFWLLYIIFKNSIHKRRKFYSSRLIFL